MGHEHSVSSPHVVSQQHDLTKDHKKVPHQVGLGEQEQLFEDTGLSLLTPGSAKVVPQPDEAARVLSHYAEQEPTSNTRKDNAAGAHREEPEPGGDKEQNAKPAGAGPQDGGEDLSDAAIQALG